MSRWEWTPWAPVISFAGLAGLGFATGHTTVGWIYLGVAAVTLIGWRQRAAARGSPWANLDLFSRRSRTDGPRSQGAVNGLNAGTALRVVLWVAFVVIAVFFVARKSTPSPSPVATSSFNLLPASTHPPAGIASRVFSPAGLGVEMTLPASWKMAPPASGFQYVMASSRPEFSGAFLGVARVNGQTKPPSIAQVAALRHSFLHGLGATITSASTGVIDGHPACTLRYALPHAGGAVSDTEFDIIVPGPLLVSLSPTQTLYDTSVTTYNDVVVVLGAPKYAPAATLLGWVASTIQVTNSATH